MALKHFSHEHPLTLSEQWSHESKKVYCSGCGELISGPSFSCMVCGFYLDKQCAEAPLYMGHPFHSPCFGFLYLRTGKPYWGIVFCAFCGKTNENFFYNCHCGLQLHIKCALFSYNIAGKRIAKFQHIAPTDPLISTENHTEELKKAECFICWKPLLNSVYFSPDCGFYLHAKCVDLPARINHQLLHKRHPLILQFNPRRLSCMLCQKTQQQGLVYYSSRYRFVLHIECASMSIPTEISNLFHSKHPLFLQLEYEGDLHCQICRQAQHKKIVYCCSICSFALHFECASIPPVIEDKSHQHPFSLFWRHDLFTCDACGTSGDHASYICSTCSIMVHKKCTSLPQIIQFNRHLHRIYHKYFLEEHGFEMSECRICYEKVNTKLGGYCCSKCSYIVHVNCLLEKPDLYHEVDSIETDEAMDSALEHVTDTTVKHFSHDHNLALIEDIKGDKQCDGCLLSIAASSYHCSQCDFFLHKDCAELPIKKHFWYHRCLNLLTLTSGYIFCCDVCGYESSGFAYSCYQCWVRYCLRCVLVSDIPICQGHEHPLPFYPEHEGLCNACGDSTTSEYRCKDCNFVLHHSCITLPLTARHKSDDHILFLTYQDENDYPESHYCDICEKSRNPKHWFYHCKICNSSAHPKCVLGRCAFIKLGSIDTYRTHLHPLTLVQVHDYPECHTCGKLCPDLALECKTVGCSYIVHWKCTKTSSFRNHFFF